MGRASWIICSADQDLGCLCSSWGPSGACAMTHLGGAPGAALLQTSDSPVQICNERPIVSQRGHQFAHPPAVHEIRSIKPSPSENQVTAVLKPPFHVCE